VKKQLIEQIISSLKMENICNDYIKSIDIVTNVIISPEKYTQGNKVAVIPLETGCGKSSITNISLAWLANNDLASAGTIILKERIEDCEGSVKQINELCGKEVAMPFHSKIFNINGKYSYKYERDYRNKLFKYPILVMTHQGFIRRNYRLEDYLVWSDEENVFDVKHIKTPKHRTRLIVDE